MRKSTAFNLLIFTCIFFFHSFVVEYARICNPKLKIIGSAGSAEKVEIMKKIGCDVTINYKEQDTAEILKEHGPIDMYAAFCLISYYNRR